MFSAQKVFAVIGSLVLMAGVATAGCGSCESSGSGSKHKMKDSAYSLGDKVQDFTLPNSVSGKEQSLSDLAGKKGAVVVFWNQECPYVVEAQDRINAFHKKYSDKGIKVVAIDAGTNNSPEEIKKHAKELAFPVLINHSSDIAAKFGATRTPETFLLNSDMQVVYHGAFDSGEVKEGSERKDYTVNAAKQVLEGEKPETQKTKAFGCTINYHEGVEPMKTADASM